VLVEARLSERTLLTLFLIPVTILAVAGIVANAILPTLIAEAPALVPALTTRADRLLLVAPLLPGEVFLSIALVRELIGDPLFYLFGRRYGETGIRWLEQRSPNSRWEWIMRSHRASSCSRTRFHIRLRVWHILSTGVAVVWS